MLRKGMQPDPQEPEGESPIPSFKSSSAAKKDDEEEKKGGLAFWSGGKKKGAGWLQGSEDKLGGSLVRARGAVTRGGVLDRLKSLKKRDLIFIASGLAVLLMAPLAEFLVTSPEQQPSSLQSGFDRKGALFSESGSPYEEGVAGIAPGGLLGQENDVITPLNVRDPSALVMGPVGAEKAAQAVQPPAAKKPEAPPPDFSDAIKMAGKKAVQKAPGLPRPSAKLAGALKDWAGVLSAARGGGGPSFTPAPPQAALPAKPRVGSSLVRAQAIPGFRGGGRSLAPGGGGGAPFGRPGPGGGGSIDGSGGSGVSGGGAGQGGAGGNPPGEGTKSPGGNSSKDSRSTSQPPENLAMLAAKLNLEQAIKLFWDKKRYDELERKKMLEQMAAQTASQALLKIIEGLLQKGKGDGDKGGGGGDKGGKGSPTPAGPHQPSPGTGPLGGLPGHQPRPDGQGGPPGGPAGPPPGSATVAWPAHAAAVTSLGAFGTAIDAVNPKELSNVGQFMVAMSMLNQQQQALLLLRFSTLGLGQGTFNPGAISQVISMHPSVIQTFLQKSRPDLGDFMEQVLQPGVDRSGDWPYSDANMFYRGAQFLNAADSLETAKGKLAEARNKLRETLSGGGGGGVNNLAAINERLGTLNTNIGNQVTAAGTAYQSVVIQLNAMQSNPITAAHSATLQALQAPLAQVVTAVTGIQNTDLTAVKSGYDPLGPLVIQQGTKIRAAVQEAVTSLNAFADEADRLSREAGAHLGGPTGASGQPIRDVAARLGQARDSGENAVRSTQQAWNATGLAHAASNVYNQSVYNVGAPGSPSILVSLQTALDTLTRNNLRAGITRSPPPPITVNPRTIPEPMEVLAATSNAANQAKAATLIQQTRQAVSPLNPDPFPTAQTRGQDATAKLGTRGAGT